MKENAVIDNSGKQDFLEGVIRRAAVELERTKNAFKSRRVKEVREMLLASIER